ncbi:MAG: C4-type zinc ribbon domain-containing protein [Verrucomicrobiia bacterium]
MLETLNHLLLLQQHDKKIRALQRQKQNLPLEQTRLQQQLTHQQQSLQSQKLEAQKIEANRKKLDLEAQTQQQHIFKLRTQLQQTRKNEEYSALLHEIEQAEKSIVTLEDEELVLMEQYEQATAHWNEEAKKNNTKEKIFQEQINQMKDQLEGVEKELTQLLAERSAYLKNIPEDILNRYERLLQSKDDAIVPIEHRTVCGGCHLTLMSQTLLDCKTQNKMVSCENCGRFLYWPN